MDQGGQSQGDTPPSPPPPPPPPPAAMELATAQSWTELEHIVDSAASSSKYAVGDVVKKITERGHESQAYVITQSLWIPENDRIGIQGRPHWDYEIKNIFLAVLGVDDREATTATFIRPYCSS